MANPPILLLHGIFGRPSLMEPWVRFFTDAGFRCHVPALPGREPSDDAVLSRTSVSDMVDVALKAYDAIGEPAIVVGHSMGGLLAQKVAAARDPLAVVLLAAIPPGVLWPQIKVLPHFVPLMPMVLAGRPFLPSPEVMRVVPLSTLPRDEQDRLIPLLVRDSGRAFRALLLGAPVTRVAASDVRCPVLCVSAGSDRNVAPWMSRRIAERYGAEHQIHPGLPHWIIAESALQQVAPPVLDWLRRTLRLG
ncbi:alpha/beta fold hydrolase [Mycobacterium sp. 236(2023)]|uniref:alpha/beta hydrolase n=1 Tax=Mycobacterium sp. 236(2023) TaxID=3038163 RepID=UPI0024156C2D|nr:alpha/beta fold hydrolase [Mycobacterium sp. 236(2023)]MDG4669010.1 alpha/beta fold hydrolase [Mycobacterium sp. 236(2023)]